MTFKITLITPPDIYQNDCDSIMFVDITDQEQDAISKWLGEQDLNNHLNIYFYQGEPNISWFLHALSTATYKYINLANMSSISSYLVGYLLSKPNVFYTVEDQNVAELFSHINLNRVDNSVEFLKRVFSGKE